MTKNKKRLKLLVCDLLDNEQAKKQQDRKKKAKNKKLPISSNKGTWGIAEDVINRINARQERGMPQEQCKIVASLPKEMDERE